MQMVENVKEERVTKGKRGDKGETNWKDRRNGIVRYGMPW